MVSGKHKIFGELAKHGFIWFILFFAFFPFLLMIVISFKTNAQFVTNPWLPAPPFHTENWTAAWSEISGYIANSVVVSVSAVALTLSCSLMAAYAFAKYRFPGSTFLWYALLSLMLLPAVVNLVPLFFVLKSLGLLNTLTAIVLVGAAAGQVFCIYVLRNFIEEIPNDLFEAAEIDGATHVQKVWNLVLPLCAPIVGTLAIMQFLANWNNLVLPMLIVRDSSKFTIPVGLMMLTGEYDKDWGRLMAGYVISSIPLVVIFVFTMRLFVRGLAAGGIKG